MSRAFIAALIAFFVIGSSFPAACSKKAPPPEEAVDQGTPAGASPAPKHGRPSDRLVDTTGPTATSSAVTERDPILDQIKTTSQAATQVATTPELKAMAEKYGIIVSDISLKGKMIEVQFQLLDPDPEKNGPIRSPAVKRSLIDVKSGTTLLPPSGPRGGLVGPVYGDPKRYRVSFNNADGVVKSGDRVSLMIGDYRVDNLFVR